MSRLSYSPQNDQFDEKVFRESLGSFGTTTLPGANQLIELQAKVRQGVKNVELVLASRGKGQFGAQDVPDKYGFQEKRTIMQLAKLNNINLSVHSSPEIVSFSGLGQQGFDEVQRWDALKEIEETIKFAAETAKGGAIVMHLQGEGISTSRGELNLSKSYLNWLKKNRSDEYDRLKKEYFTENPLDRTFVNNPEKKQEFNFDYLKIDEETRKNFEKENADKIAKGAKAAELFYLERQKDKMKLVPELHPAVVVGDKIQQVERQQEFIDLAVLKGQKNILDNNDKKLLNDIGVDVGEKTTIQDFQKAMAIFSNGKPNDLKISDSDFKKLQNKLLITYDKVLEKNDYLQNQADTEFFKELVNMQVDMYDLQKKHLEQKKAMFSNELERIEILERESKNVFAQMNKVSDSTPEGKATRDILKNHISQKNQELQVLKYQVVGQENYHELSNFDSTIAEINKKKKELSKQVKDAKSLADESFEKNISGLSFMGIKALKYQLDLKAKAKEAETKLPEFQNKLKNLREQYNKEKNYEMQDKLADEISKLEYDMSKWVGMKDYGDIDVDKNPLYLAPENMLPGMGSLTSVEEFKAVIRMGQEDFAKKILSDDKNFEDVRKRYEKETGKQIKTHDDALELAKKHLAGTFDTAHAGAWLKHFNKIEGESEESRIDRFNDWLKSQAKTMVDEGLIKHVHFNNTTGKDDDHNLIGSGILDMHGLRKIFRSGGITDPLIIEAGGRGPNVMMHLDSAFKSFNPLMGVNGFRGNHNVSSGVSDWISVKRDYERRPQYSTYGMNESTFAHIPPQQGQERGSWSGTSFF